MSGARNDQAGKIQTREKCGAKTTRGTVCQGIAVKGIGRCACHGGGKALRARYIAELARNPREKRRAWLVRQIDKGTRNKSREHIKYGRAMADAENDMIALKDQMRAALKEGRCTREVIGRWIEAVRAVRPYREAILMPMVYRALLGEFGPMKHGAETVSGTMGLDPDEHMIFMRALGFRAG